MVYDKIVHFHDKALILDLYDQASDVVVVDSEHQINKLQFEKLKYFIRYHKNFNGDIVKKMVEFRKCINCYITFCETNI